MSEVYGEAQEESDQEEARGQGEGQEVMYIVATPARQPR